MSENIYEKACAAYKETLNSPACAITNKDCVTERQNNANDARENFFASLSDEMKKRYEIIHKAASLLDEAKIPFLLVAVPNDRDKMPLGFQYSKYSYIDMYNEDKSIIPEAFENWRNIAWEITRTANGNLSGAISPLTICIAAPEGEIIREFSKGKTFDHFQPALQPPVESNEKHS